MPAAIGLVMAGLGVGMLVTLRPMPVVSALADDLATILALVGTASALLLATCRWDRCPRVPPMRTVPAPSAA